MVDAHLDQLSKPARMESFLPHQTGRARGPYYQVLRGIGNPTLKTLDRIATSLNMSVLELLGFDVDDARRAPKRSGVSYDSLASTLTKRNEAERRVARQGRSRSLPS